jgi:AsmA protein
VSLSGVKVSNPQSFDKNPFLDLKSFDVAVELLPLLNKEVKIQYVQLSDIDINIIKSKQGTMNVAVQPPPAAQGGTAKEAGKETEAAEKPQLPLIQVDKVLLSNVNISYADLATDTKAIVDDIDLVVTNISYDASKEGLKAVAFDGDIDIAQVVYDKYVLSKIAGAFAFKDAVATVSKLDYSIFSSRTSGSAVINLAGKVPEISLKKQIPALNLAVLAKTLAEKDLLEGTVDTRIDLKFRGSDAKAIKKSLAGNISVVGKGLGVIGYDLDKVLAQYDKSQNFDAVDIGAFLVAGPIGTLLTKGGDVGGALAGMKGGKTLLKDLVLQTDIKNGLAQLTDVAVATPKNRLAVKGALHLPAEQFKDVSVGVLEANGCAKYSQTITGTFTKPSIKVDQAAVSQVTNLVGSVFKQAKGLLPGTKKQECSEPFYQGAVAHPAK